MGYYETDPLLPNDKPAPEIQGSRAGSINDVLNDDQDEPSTSEVYQSYRTAKRQENNGYQSIGDIESAARHSVRTDSSPSGFFIAMFVFLFCLVMLVAEPWPEDMGPGSGGWPWKKLTVEQRANKILESTPLIDGHNDLAILVRYLFNNHIYDDDFKGPFENGGMMGHVDLPRLKAGKQGGAFWAAYVGCPKNGTDYSDENYVDTVKMSYSQIDLLVRLQAAYPDVFSAPPNSSTALGAFRNGKIISPIAIEGLHQIGNSATNLRNYHSLGVRYATLTHNCHNKYADAALVEESGHVVVAKPLWGGVSPAGRDLIKEMNRLGMIVDLAHVSHDTQHDVLGGVDGEWDGSAAPPIFSHSSAYAICPHPRNVQDDILQLVKKRNSVVMVNFSPDFISCTANSSSESGLPDFYPANSTLQHVVEHITYIGNLIGYDHVGLGSDFDGIPNVPEGLEDVSKFPELVTEMLKKGISDVDAAKVVGGNLLRVWNEVDKVALNMQAAGVKPLEDDLPGLKFLGQM